MIYPDFTGIRPALVRVDPLRDDLRLGREEAGRAARESREELSRDLAKLSETNPASLDRARTTLNAGVREPQDGNEKQLESVQKGLGERQSLATGAGDLKRMLGDVKARGTWAEVQLGASLDEILAPVIRLEAHDISRKYVKPSHTADLARFGDVLAKVKRQLDAASRTIGHTVVRPRAVERKVRAVEQLPGDKDDQTTIQRTVRHRARHRRRVVGQHVPAVLALAGAVRHRPDGGGRLRLVSYGGVRGGLAHGRARLRHLRARRAHVDRPGQTHRASRDGAGWAAGAA